MHGFPRRNHCRFPLPCMPPSNRKVEVGWKVECWEEEEMGKEVASVAAAAVAELEAETAVEREAT